MDHEFWIEKWETEKLGFHQEKINSRLEKYWNQTGGLKGSVFVPLCGKSKDMLWLAENGWQVFGVELSEIACRGFFEENDIDYNETQDERFRYFKSNDIEVRQGDFFSLQREDFEGVNHIYDRASLIALPEKMRQRYVEHLTVLTKEGDQILLISMDYDETKMKGPPFSVTEKEVAKLFNLGWDIDLIGQSSGPEIVGNLAERGLDTLTEKVYLITRQ